MILHGTNAVLIIVCICILEVPIVNSQASKRWVSVLFTKRFVYVRGMFDFNVIFAFIFFVS